MKWGYSTGHIGYEFISAQLTGLSAILLILAGDHEKK